MKFEEAMQLMREGEEVSHPTLRSSTLHYVEGVGLCFHYPCLHPPVKNIQDIVIDEMFSDRWYKVEYEKYLGDYDGKKILQ